MTRALTITSGKGGVGKTNISLNVALQLANLGNKVCLFDADLGLANINILLGIQPDCDIDDLIHNNKSLEEVLFSVQGIDILPGSSGVEELANLEPEILSQLLAPLRALDNYDYLLFDTSAGIAKNVIAFCLSCPETLVIITPEPTSLTDAYALLKVLAANDYKGSIKVIINQCPDIQSAKQVYKRFKDAVNQYVKLPIEALGVIYKDSKVTAAVSRQSPLIRLFPDSISSKCIKKITERLLENCPEEFDQMGTPFWEHCLNFMATPLHLVDSPKRQDARSGTKAQNMPQTTAPEQGAEADALSSSRSIDLEEQLFSPFTPSLIPLANTISEGIFSISKELKELRHELCSEHNGTGGTSPEETDRANRNQPVVRTINLDLDKYLREKEDSSEE